VVLVVKPVVNIAVVVDVSVVVVVVVVERSRVVVLEVVVVVVVISISQNSPVYLSVHRQTITFCPNSLSPDPLP
jgi:hypothetical protein